MGQKFSLFFTRVRIYVYFYIHIQVYIFFISRVKNMKKVAPIAPKLHFLALQSLLSLGQLLGQTGQKVIFKPIKPHC